MVSGTGWTVRLPGGVRTIKLLVTGALLALVARQLNFTEIKNLLASLHNLPLVAVVALVVFSIVLSAYKWQVLLRARGWKISLSTLSRVYFVGIFMNNFLPSSIGGDMMRIYQVGDKINNTSEAAASVILERLLATVGLALLAVVALVPNSGRLGAQASLVLEVLAVCLVITFVVARPSVLRPLKRIEWAWWQKIVVMLQKINLVIQSYREQPRAILAVVLYSMLFQLTIVIINYFLLQAMGITAIHLWHCAIVVPIISAVSMIPVSINGLGIREASYVILFQPLGLTATQAVTLSLLFFLVVTLVSLIGGVFFVLDKKQVGVMG